MKNAYFENTLFADSWSACGTMEILLRFSKQFRNAKKPGRKMCVSLKEHDSRLQKWKQLDAKDAEELRENVNSWLTKEVPAVNWENTISCFPAFQNPSTKMYKIPGWIQMRSKPAQAPCFLGTRARSSDCRTKLLQKKREDSCHEDRNAKINTF